MLGNGKCIVAMALHAQRQGLNAGEEHKGIERREGWAQIAQTQDAASNGKGKIAKGLAEHHAIIFRPWAAQHGIALIGHPIE